MAGELLAQEAIRASLAGQDAADARKRASAALGYYNLRMGDWRLRMSSTLGLEFDDNVRLEDDGSFTTITTNTSTGTLVTNTVVQHPNADFIVRPTLNIQSTVPVSQRNTFDFGLGVGYSFYLQNRDLGQLFLTPNTGLSFDVYVKDFVINLHDRFYMSQQSYQNVAVSGTGDYGYFQNTAGIGVTWDLNRLTVMAGYDHVLRLATTSGFNQQDGMQQLFSASVAYRLNNVSTVGLELGSGLIQYDEDTLKGGVQYSAGLLYRWQVGRHFNLRANAGYFVYYLDTTNAPAATSPKQTDTVSGMYGMLSLDHRVNQVLSYSLEAGRQIQLGLFSDTLDLYYARLRAEWGIMRKMPITTQLSYENVNGSTGTDEKIQRIGGGVAVTRPITRKMVGSLSYDMYSRTSNEKGRDYLQNRVLLTLGYNF